MSSCVPPGWRLQADAATHRIRREVFAVGFDSIFAEGTAGFLFGDTTGFLHEFLMGLVVRVSVRTVTSSKVLFGGRQERPRRGLAWLMPGRGRGQEPDRRLPGPVRLAQ